MLRFECSLLCLKSLGPNWGASSGARQTFCVSNYRYFFAGLWTIPVGVAIGLIPSDAHCRSAQVAASVPASALFPIVLLVLIRVGGGFGLGSVVLLLLGTPWYVLFSVIAGAAIGTDLEGCGGVTTAQRWRSDLAGTRSLSLRDPPRHGLRPPWNASIVAGYFRLKACLHDRQFRSDHLARSIRHSPCCSVSTIVIALVGGHGEPCVADAGLAAKRTHWRSEGRYSLFAIRSVALNFWLPATSCWLSRRTTITFPTLRYMYFRNLDGVEPAGTMEVGGLVSLVAELEGSPRARRIFENRELEGQVLVVVVWYEAMPGSTGKSSWSDKGVYGTDLLGKPLRIRILNDNSFTCNILGDYSSTRLMVSIFWR